ncbi:hypothetical protein NW762_006396 [Fusarium torreyae]|uniref:BTB domain-containing protein n=1 Tax=Fusarium torreyae TaxID=1237075 RepID=A0A9W8S1X9_9HYPO|nr:hypothetical protein NW762_006396 [Fusarium torreyae]
MKSISYDIDPGGDVEIVLTKPNTQNVVPDLDLHGPKGPSSHLLEVRKGDPDSKKFDSTWLFDDYQTLGDLNKVPTGKQGDQETTKTTEFRMRVSSRHLTFASPVFKAMLHGPWIEGNSSTSFVREISATEWNPQALAVVLNVLHGRFRQVPRIISIKFFVDITIIAEYYQCEEAMQFCAETWYADAYKPLETFCKKSIMWLYIAWVFPWPDLLLTMTKVALKHSQGLDTVKTKDLPVAQVLGIVDEARQELIGRLLVGIDELHDKLSTEFGCPRNKSIGCSATTLGSLVRGTRPLDHLDAPFEGHSVAEVLGIIQDLDHPRPSTIDRGGDACAYDYATLHNCSATSRMKPVVSGVKKDMEMIGLASFKLEAEEDRAKEVYGIFR